MKGAAAIIAAVDETETLPAVLEQVGRLCLSSVLVVVNGPSEKPARLAAAAGATVIRHEHRVGYDVGRGLGAAHASDADALLFLDADLPIPAHDLRPFVEAALTGVDVALNRIDRYIQAGARLHPVNSAKRFLNAVSGRRDLGCASLTAIPHALSRRALAHLGVAVLATPPLALAQAIAAGLRVEAVHAVDVVSSNARRPGLNEGGDSPVEQLILGDHLEAIAWLQRTRGDARAGFTDLGRRRDLLMS